MAPAGQWRAQLPHFTPSVLTTQLSRFTTACPIWTDDFSSTVTGRMAPAGHIHTNYNASRNYTLEHILFRDTVFFLSSISTSGCTSYYEPIHVTVLPNVQYNVSPIAVEEPVNKVYMSRDTIKVRLKNFGSEQLSSIPVTYTKHRSNNVSMEYQQVTETCNAIIPPGGEYVFAFDSLADFSIITGTQNYTITIWTDLPNEETRENDTIQTTVTPINENMYCEPEVTGASGMDITSVRVGTLENNIPAIGHTYMNFVNYTTPNIPTLSLYKLGDKIAMFTVPSDITSSHKKRFLLSNITRTTRSFSKCLSSSI